MSQLALLCSDDSQVSVSGTWRSRCIEGKAVSVGKKGAGVRRTCTGRTGFGWCLYVLLFLSSDRLPFIQFSFSQIVPCDDLTAAADAVMIVQHDCMKSCSEKAKQKGKRREEGGATASIELSVRCSAPELMLLKRNTIG